jgi:hypothetical protein
MKKSSVLLLLVVILLSLATAVLANEQAEVADWQTTPLKAGTGAYLPCGSGIVTAYTMDGMAVVECHEKPAKR